MAQASPGGRPLGTLEERWARLDGGPRPSMAVMMLGDGTPLKAGSLRNLAFGGAPIGFELGLNNLSYRDINISTLEDIRLTVDGVPVDRDRVLFRIHQLSVVIDNLAHLGDVTWGATDDVRLTVYQLGGLEPGEHTVTIEIDKRADFGHSYGDGAEGWERATEFHQPDTLTGTTTFVVE